MIKLSVNVNKIATIRNSRGGDIPNLIEFSEIILNAGAQGITIHPREDERHIKKKDVGDLHQFLKSYNQQYNKNIEYNIEGEPSERYLNLVLTEKPNQATLVPVTPGEITSDHGFDLKHDAKALEPIIKKIKSVGTRVSLFVDPDVKNLTIAKEIGADRIELYTGPFAHAYMDKATRLTKYDSYVKTAEEALYLGLEINAGHDLDHENLKLFKKLPGLKEVSIGHRLISNALIIGLHHTVQLYLKTLATDD